MITYDLDPDVVRWGLQDLDVCTLTAGSCSSVTRYDTDSSELGYVQEGYNEPMYTYVENDAVIAQALQEELSRVAEAEESGFTNPDQESIIVQDWLDPSGRYHSSGHENGQKAANDPVKNEKGKDFHDEGNDFSTKKNEECENCSVGENSFIEEDLLHSLDITDDSSALDGEVGKRLNHMIPVPHVPKTNGEIPSADEEISDHQRLLDRLQLYDLIENKIQGDGNCQFRALSDQLYRSSDYHKFVRELVVNQLKSHPEMYDGYVPMAYGNYLKKMSKSGEWGDHVTLQAAADIYGVKIFVITSFKDTCYIEILPHIQKSERVICLSFWAEVHYNSIYPEGELPMLEVKKKKGWWLLGSK